MNVNGKVYDWGDVDLSLPGIATEVQEISYDDELEKELSYGKGYKPRGYGNGKYKASGKISLLRDDYDMIINYCKAKGVAFYALTFPKIVVSYANAGDRTRQDVLNKVSFAKASHKAAQGDKSLKIDLDLIIAGQIVRDGLEAI